MDAALGVLALRFGTLLCHFRFQSDPVGSLGDQGRDDANLAHRDFPALEFLLRLGVPQDHILVWRILLDEILCLK